MYYKASNILCSIPCWRVHARPFMLILIVLFSCCTLFNFASLYYILLCIRYSHYYNIVLSNGPSTIRRPYSGSVCVLFEWKLRGDALKPRTDLSMFDKQKMLPLDLARPPAICNCKIIILNCFCQVFIKSFNWLDFISEFYKNGTKASTQAHTHRNSCAIRQDLNWRSKFIWILKRHVSSVLRRRMLRLNVSLSLKDVVGT